MSIEIKKYSGQKQVIRDLLLFIIESKGIGQMANEMGVSVWCAPAMNTHRSAFGGRNFEYYSEDGVLAGNIAAQAVKDVIEYKKVKQTASHGKWLAVCCRWCKKLRFGNLHIGL